jgi:hypothetical protein
MIENLHNENHLLEYQNGINSAEVTDQKRPRNGKNPNLA